MRKSIAVFLFSFILTLFTFQSFSQCAMCKRTVETSQSENNNSGRGLNKGIIYLLSVPYLLGGIGFIAWYKNRKKISN